ncbi:MAG: FliG C-terminal domain-containing protein [Planctomycetota bacterium]
MSISGHKKVAAFLLTLEPDVAAQLLQKLDPWQISKVSKAMIELKRMNPDDASVVAILREFKGLAARGGGLLQNVPLEAILNKALGEQQGVKLYQEAEQMVKPKNPFAFLQDLPREAIVLLLRDEHPQIIALALSHLDPALAARTLQGFPTETQIDLIARMATREAPPSESIQEIAKVLAARVSEAAVSDQAAGKLDAPIKGVAEVLNNIEADVEKELFEALRNANADLAQKIDEERLQFADILLLEAKAVQKLLASIETKTLAMALKGGREDIEQHLLKNVSKRNQGVILEEREQLGPLPRTDVQNAQKEILKAVRALIDAGDIKLKRGGSDDLVA